MRRPIFVTGGAGYIGSHCCRALAAAGFTPVVYDNLSTGHRAFVRWGPLIEGDVRDGARLSAALRDTAPVAVIHFAALALAGESVERPGAYYDVNVNGTLRLLEAMVGAGVPHLVFSSSCAVYGETGPEPVAEGVEGIPASPYGATKLACEWLIRAFAEAHGIRAARLRYFNAAGADPGGALGEVHDPETHLVPLAIMTALGQRAELAVYGTDYDTPDGTAVRDYIHVDDLAAGHLAALDYLLEGGAPDAFNLGTGVGVSVAEVAATVERLAGRPLPVRHAPRRPGDPPVAVADPACAADVLGWRARYGFEEIVTHALRWHREHAPAIA